MVSGDVFTTILTCRWLVTTYLVWSTDLYSIPGRNKIIGGSTAGAVVLVVATILYFFIKR